MKKKSLPKARLNAKTFEWLLDNVAHLERVDSLAPYMSGYADKHVVRYTRGSDSDMLIIKMMYLKAKTVENYDYTDGWKQIICIKDSEQKEDVIFDTIGPIDAVKRVAYKLKTVYTDSEIEECYRKHEAEANEAEILKHNIITSGGLEKDVIYKFTDCVYEDKNGAYNSKLAVIFDKLSSWFNYLNDHRHDNHNEYKLMSNFFVGCMTQNKKKFIDGKPTRNIHPKTRFWIIREITNEMNERMNATGKDRLLYLNTDGYIVQHPKKQLPTSDKMGDFKLEAKGDVYMFRCKSGWCMQYTKMNGEVEIKGSIPLELRNQIDLSKGKAIEYDIVKTNTGGNVYKNIKEKDYEIITIK